MEVTKSLMYVLCFFLQKNANHEALCCSNCIMNSMKVFHFLAYFSLELFLKVFDLHKTFFEFFDDSCYHSFLMFNYYL